ncbi:MAG: polysaccharide deacetylase family protein [Pirellulaceae bacterium]
MNRFDSTLIETYRYATMPSRVALEWWMKRKGKLPVAALFYHRVSNDVCNDWTISPQDFERQIEWLSSRFDIVTLQECQRRLRSMTNRRPTLAITFDDGYSDNCQWAIPYLLERRIPFTYFVTVDNIVEQKPFPHDVQNGRPLPVNTMEEIYGLFKAGVEIGGHTRTHANMGAIDDLDQIESEVFDSINELESYLGSKIRYFAFPFGQIENLNAQVFRMAKERGLEGVCSAYGGFNFSNEDPFHIKRFHGDPSLSRIKNWLTFDYRNLRSPAFQYDLDSPNS